MRQARTVLSTYSADTFGVCSALYELGGMIVMHDASGCNSTYSTHDEPRCYHSDAMVFISGLTEIEAIMGDDEKLIGDILETVDALHPAFTAIAGTPIPMMTGFDFDSVAREIEERSGIPCFGFPTNGMRSYLCGASEALDAFARRMTVDVPAKRKNAVNLLGVTPLDFSVNGTAESMRAILREHGYEVTGCWSMGSSLEDLRRAGEAEVNLVASGVGMKAAKYLKSRFGTPYVVGAMTGKPMTEQILRALKQTLADGKDRVAFCGGRPDPGFCIIGEGVVSRSLASAVALERGVLPRVIDPFEALPELEGILSPSDVRASGEEEIQKICRDAGTVVADPLYRPILPKSCRFVPMPHEAFSGRIWRRQIPDFTKIEIKGMVEE